MNSRQIIAQHLLGRLAKKPRKGFTLIELLVVVVIIGILASVALPSFVGAQDKARNSSVTANIGTVRMALEQFGTDNNGSYPDEANWANDGSTVGSEGIRYNNYLPGNKFPLSPWSKQPQVNPTKSDGVSTTGTGAAALKTAADVANGDSPSDAVNKPLGDGKVVAQPAAKEDYGVLMYDYDTDTQTYVLYGVGKRNKEAIVVNAVSNNGQ